MAKTTRRTNPGSTTTPSSTRTASTSTGTKTATGRPRARIATPTEEQIRVRAFEIYLARNGGPGDAAADWAQAEAELTGRL